MSKTLSVTVYRHRQQPPSPPPPPSAAAAAAARQHVSKPVGESYPGKTTCLLKRRSLANAERDKELIEKSDIFGECTLPCHCCVPATTTSESVDTTHTIQTDGRAGYRRKILWSITKLLL